MWCTSCRRFCSWGRCWRGMAFGFCGPLLGCTSVYQHIWEPMCAAALDAMAFGRRMLWAVQLDEQPNDPQQTQITRFFPALSPRRRAPVVRAGRRAAAGFWERLQNLVMLDDYLLKDQRWESVSHGHPFLLVADVPDRPEMPRRFVVKTPAAVQQA